ncbi:TPA: hypothetical protein ACG7DI_004491, partial [Escherichia coli]
NFIFSVRLLNLTWQINQCHVKRNVNITHYIKDVIPQEDEVTDRQYYKPSSHCLFLTDDCNGFLIVLIFMGYCCFLLVFYEL